MIDSSVDKIANTFSEFTNQMKRIATSVENTENAIRPTLEVISTTLLLVQDFFRKLNQS